MEYLNENLMVGKEYYLNGKLKYEGEYLKVKKWNGISYDMDGNILYLKLKMGMWMEKQKSMILMVI